MSYLSGRTQKVAIGSTLSIDYHLECGVPQGSVLGPKLYSIFSRPIGNICLVNNIQHHCYADDTQAYLLFKPKNWDNTALRLETCMKEIKQWMCANMLKLNQDKTEFIVFSPKHHVKDLPSYHLNFSGTIIKESPNVKNLGVWFDKTLSMQKQISSVSRSCYHQIRNIGRIRPLITEGACKTLICALVTSRLDYANALLYGVNSNELAKLQKIQNTAARITTRTKRREHITPVLKTLHWLPVAQRIEYKILVHTYKAINIIAPQYIRELIHIYQPGRSLRSENKHELVRTKFRTSTYGNRRLDVAAASLWNSLPSQLHSCPSVHTFKKHLKTHLFKKAFGL